MKLLIFDIDGTLTHLNGATRRAFDVAYRRVFGVPANIAGIKMHGRTDPLIFRDTYLASGLTGNWITAYTEFAPVYLDELPACIHASAHKRMLPGVPELLLRLADAPRSVALALGTGNMEAGARIKIGFFDLNRYFPVGGFGDRHEARREIMFDAVRNSVAHYGVEFDPRNTWVIGDTIHDIEGGKSAGLRTLGVSTGGAFNSDELLDAGADIVMSDLSNTDAVFHALDIV